MKKSFKFLFSIIVLLSMTVSCGDDIEPIELFYDSDGYVFLENGKRHPATTQFTSEEMLQRLKETAWKRDYAFYYDKNKAGKRNEIAFYEQNFFVFQDDGAAFMGAVGNPSVHSDYTYSISNRDISMKSSSTSYMMRIIAIDDTMMVTDTSLAGQNIYGYDDATVMQRTVFKNHKIIN